MSDENTQTTEAAPETAPEAPPAEAPAPETAPAEPAEPTEAAPAEGEPAKTEPEETPEAKHKRAGGWQRKIDKLERELAAVRAQQTQPAKPAEPEKPKTAEEQLAEYVSAQVEKRLAEREAQRQQATVAEAFAARTQEVRKEHPDFDEVVASVDVQVSPAVSQLLLTSEQGPRIMYQLAASPAELARISALPPLDAAREFGRLEAKMASVTAAPAKPSPTPVPRKSAAPAPITPVTPRGPTTIKDPGAMSYEEFKAWRESQSKR